MSQDMYYGKDYKKLPVYSTESGEGVEVRPDVYMFTDQIANLIFVGRPEASEFVIVDTGMPKRGETVIKAAKERFGENARPKAIILTHGHFDHVGTVIELIEEWGAPVYAHPLEFPFLTGEKPYPTADTSVEGGLVASMSSVFPIDPINIADHLHPLPENGEVPELPDFEWVHTPGHTPGQVALFRAEDGLLLSGDAFVTTQQEDFFNVAFQNVEISGPPAYLTPNWEEAGESVRKLQQLRPQTVIAGHGQPVEGEELHAGLDELLATWHDDAVPDHGKYVEDE
jgi:glyoxylase-like metal-dependent hydrolase (beta-lactamase superfamily II)